MLVKKAVQFCVLAAAGAWLWAPRGCDAATSASAAVRLCGRHLSNIMSRICHTYNSPAWDEPLEEQPDSVVRKRRQVGIADECCIYGCTWEQLTSYCAISSTSEALHEMEAHMIANRSTEAEAAKGASAATGAGAGGGAAGGAGLRGVRGARAEVGRRSRGYGRGAGRRGCRCRRKRRDGRRRSIIGNMDRLRVVARAAPVVGTVSPLLTWGRTVHTDQPPAAGTGARARAAYVAVFRTRDD